MIWSVYIPATYDGVEMTSNAQGYVLQNKPSQELIDEVESAGGSIRAIEDPLSGSGTPSVEINGSEVELTDEGGGDYSYSYPDDSDAYECTITTKSTDGGTTVILDSKTVYQNYNRIQGVAGGKPFYSKALSSNTVYYINNTDGETIFSTTDSGLATFKDDSDYSYLNRFGVSDDGIFFYIYSEGETHIVRLDTEGNFSSVWEDVLTGNGHNRLIAFDRKTEKLHGSMCLYSNKAIYVIIAKDGTVLSEEDITDDTPAPTELCAMAVYNDNVWKAKAQGEVWCNGSKIYTPDSVQEYQLMACPDGYCYASLCDGNDNIHILKLSTSSLEWKYELGKIALYSPVPPRISVNDSSVIMAVAEVDSTEKTFKIDSSGSILESWEGYDQWLGNGNNYFT